MKDFIINSFILQDNNTLIDIYNYIKFRYNKSVEINDIKIEDASFFIIYNETEDIHYFFTKDLNKNNK